MKYMINILIIATINQACVYDFGPNIVPNIIIDLVSDHVYQRMSETEKVKCKFINDYLETQGRHFLIANPKFAKAMANFVAQATDHNCQEILNQLANILHGEGTKIKNQYKIDYNYIKLLLFKQQNSAADKAYFNYLVGRHHFKEINCAAPLNFEQICFYKKYFSRYVDQSQNKLLNMNFTDHVGQKIKDALAPSSKDDLKKIETIYKYILKKTTSWLTNFKNLVR